MTDDHPGAVVLPDGRRGRANNSLEQAGRVVGCGRQLSGVQVLEMLMNVTESFTEFPSTVAVNM